MQNAECIMQIVFVGVGAHDNSNFARFVYNGGGRAPQSPRLKIKIILDLKIQTLVRSRVRKG